MESAARIFDLPIECEEHRLLAETAEMGGPNISVRYWLGRLVGRNLFRESDQAVLLLLEQYFTANGFARTARLVADKQVWPTLANLLQQRVEMDCGSRLTHNSKRLAAIEACLANPMRSNREIASIAGTTERQVNRIAEISLLRRLWERNQA